MSLEQNPSANYTVLARRYRPGRFEECIGQEHVAQALRNAIHTNRVAHAYLFSGSRGVGKTSMARIFAKALNCANGPTADPCGQCESCLAITAGSDLDVVEIDGASNRGIEEIRELRQGVAYRPSRSRYKIYIIDEVHMLTKEAFNALLKTLEEPPAHVKFVFATTEAQKIPITILSRCQRYDFAGIGMPQIQNRLREIIAGEGMSADEEAIEIVARRARGSMRDSQSLLDQVLAFASGHLTPDMVHRLLGTAGDQRVADLVQAILDSDAATCFAMVDTAVNEGIQLSEWIEQTLDYFRDLLVLSMDEQATMLSMPSRMKDTLIAQARSISPERMMEMMDILAACRTRMKASTFGRTLVEMTLVRLCRLDNFISLDEAVAAAPQANVKSQVGPKQTPPSVKKNEPSRPITEQPEPPNGIAPRHDAVATPTPAPPRAVELSQENFQNFWSQLTAVLADDFLTAMLEQATEIAFDPPDSIVLRFPTSAATSRRNCEEKAESIRQVCEQLCGRRVSIAFERAVEDSNAPAPVVAKSQLQLREEAMRDPIVRQAEELLAAKLLGEIVPIPTRNTQGQTEPLEDDA